MKPGIPARFAARALPLLISAVLAAGFMLILSSFQSNTQLTAVAPAQSGPAEIQPAAAPPTPEPNEFSPFSLDGAPAPNQVAVTYPGAPAFGALVYEDFKALEDEARKTLQNALKMREALSPYQDSLDFDTYVKKWDYQAGWDRQVNSSTPYGQNQTLSYLVGETEKSLLRARDMYAYLAVYAPLGRFLADTDYITDQGKYVVNGQRLPLCRKPDAEHPEGQEKPDPADPDHTGQVLDPILDWCSFPARLRQSVREAANIRMIFGQQFMTDAMGLHFSGTEFHGGEAAVRNELAQLRAAKYQYELAEKGLTESLSRVVGNGCYVSDFYTQAEWSLLSRAVESQETAQHHIGVRLSYMDISSPDSVPRATATATEALRRASIDGYINMIGMAGLGASRAAGAGCSVGQRPDGALAAAMAANLIETRAKAREITEGRNIFGFDVTFTPARPYKSSVPMNCKTNPVGDRGLWDEAMCAAAYAKELETDEVGNTRAFDSAQASLLTQVEEIRKNVDGEVSDKVGCSRSDFLNEPAWYDCAHEQVRELQVCLAQVAAQSTAPNNAFDACMNRPVIKSRNGEAKQALQDLRSVYVTYLGIKTQAHNIDERIKDSNDADAIVTTWLLASGIAETAAAVSQAATQAVDCLDAGKMVSGFSGYCFAGVAANAVVQGAAGAVSTAADVNIQGAEHLEEIQGRLLDQSELLIDAYAAYQQYQSKETEFLRLLGDADGAVEEAQRARAYLKASPANDPSFRIVRDSSRLVLAKQMEYASRMAYLAARRAEYEYAARLSASNFRISDIYRARTADDITRYLKSLEGVTNSLAGSPTYATNARDVRISIKSYLVQSSAAALAAEGITEPAAVAAEQERRFRAWVAEHTVLDPALDAQPVLRFTIATSLLDGGLFSQELGDAYNRYWLLKLSGIGEPKTTNNGVSMNLVTTQTGLSYRDVVLTQGGLTHLRSAAGCAFDYRLIAPAVLLGLEWAKGQDPESATAVWKGNVNDLHPYTENAFRTPAFSGRAVSSTNWEALIYTRAPDAGLPDLDLTKLTDVELIFSMTYASRTPGSPEPSECTRIDW